MGVAFCMIIRHGIGNYGLEQNYIQNVFQPKGSFEFFLKMKTTHLYIAAAYTC